MSAAPHPLVEIAIEPRSNADRAALAAALRELAAKDPAFHVVTDLESGQTILSGMSERHLGLTIDRIRNTYDVACYVGAPQVAFREMITKRVTKDYTHKKQTGGTGEFARVKIRLEPNAYEAGYEFILEVTGSVLPDEYLAGVEKGLNSVLGAGLVAGFPVVDVKIALTDGAYHQIDSSPLAFEIAARGALREALQEAGSVLLEPIMKVEIATPSIHARAVEDDLTKRRGRIEGRTGKSGLSVLAAEAPLQALLGYGARLDAITAGEGRWTADYDRFAPVPSFRDDDPPPAVSMALRE